MTLKICGISQGFKFHEQYSISRVQMYGSKLITTCKVNLAKMTTVFTSTNLFLYPDSYNTQTVL
jgi:hypothetical protein